MPRSLPFAASLCLLAVLVSCPPRPALAASVVASEPESTLGASPGPDARSAPVAASGVGPTRALQVGLLATLAPVGIGAVYSGGRGGGGPVHWGALGGAVVGVTLGPAVGLMAGGRGDLAYQGLVLRSAALGLAGALALAHWDDGTGGIASNAAIVGGSLLALSAAYDLARTPAAVGERARARAALAVRPDGALAVRVTF